MISENSAARLTYLGGDGGFGKRGWLVGRGLTSGVESETLLLSELSSADGSGSFTRSASLPRRR